MQALEWLWAALAGPDAAATEAACVPETEAELERHRDFVRRRGGVEAQVPDAKLVLWSKVLAVVEQPNGLDSFHHGTSAELWALTQQFAFDAIVWSGVPDANYWARTQTRVTDEECRTAVARLPTVLQLLHREIGNVGHYDLLGTDAVSPQPFARTPWVRRWAEGGSEAMWEVLGMPRRPERIHAPIPEAEADVWSEPETNSDVVLSDKNSDKIDMETDSVPRRPDRIHAPIPARRCQHAAKRTLRINASTASRGRPIRAAESFAAATRASSSSAPGVAVMRWALCSVAGTIRGCLAPAERSP